MVARFAPATDLAELEKPEIATGIDRE